MNVDNFMNNICYPYTYGDKDKVKYKIELVNKTIYFLKNVTHKTYKVTQVIYKCGVVQKIKIIFVTLVFALGLRFGSSKPIETRVEAPHQIETILEKSGSTLENKKMEDPESPSVRNFLRVSGGDLGKGSSPGARARNDVRRASNLKPKSKGSGFAEAWVQNPSARSRPGAANRLAQQFQPGQAEGGNGLFGRFSARPSPDPSNPGCSGGPRSITALSGQGNASSSTNQNSKIIEADDGFKAELTDRSLNHFTSKHGHDFGVDDPLPLETNQNETKYEQVRTRLNKNNKAKVGEEIEGILSNPESNVYPDVSIRGIQGRVYHCSDTDRVIVIHTEGKFEGKIMKAQPVSDAQLDLLLELNILD